MLTIILLCILSAQVLLCELNSTISRNEVVLGFFRPKSGDTQLQKWVNYFSASTIK